MVRRFITNISVFVYSEEENFEDAQLDALKQSNKINSQIIKTVPSSDSEIESFLYSPFGKPGQIRELSIDELQGKIKDQY